MDCCDTIGLSRGQKLQLKNEPSVFVEYTGEHFGTGKNTFIEVVLPNKTRKSVLYSSVLVVADEANDADAQIEKGLYGTIHDLKRLITFEKINRTLNDLIYSMEAANIDFYPHQFKPVIRFINSPAHRLVLADEVGLGKTIEAGLIWLEMQARTGARRLLIVCPPTLQDKWAIELKNKFFIDTEQVDFAGLKKKVADFQRHGDSENFALISSYQALRPGRKDRDYLGGRASKKDDAGPTERGFFYQDLRDWDDPDHPPFDLVIFDEAHYMRNASTLAYLLGQSLCLAAQGVLCISATPIHNKSEDLFSLLALIDSDFFASFIGFDNLIRINEYIVNISKIISAHRIDFGQLYDNVAHIEAENYYISSSPLFDQLKRNIDKLYDEFRRHHRTDYDLLAQTQDIAEKLNLLGRYVNRTCRREVELERAHRNVQICTVVLNPLERQFYDSIEADLREQMHAARQGSNSLGGLSLFTFFRLMANQLQATSSLAAYAYRQINGKPEESSAAWQSLGGPAEDLQREEADQEDFARDAEAVRAQGKATRRQAPVPAYRDLARSDSKFTMLLDIIDNLEGERVVLFATFHATLFYLRERLAQKGYRVALIYGKTSLAERVSEVERFRAGEVQILLSSEVGSEGIDLQCAHVVVNYDMPWNPMRVEQRIGRIDRVGQKARVLHIINFNIANTIEQRVFAKLHEKLSTATSVLGYMEEIIGKEMQDLAFDLFSQKLSRSEEEARIEQTARVLAKKAALLKELEEKSAALAGFSDYIQEKIKGTRANREYISAAELASYFKDFFGRFFMGTLIQEDIPAPGCLRVALSMDARQSLEQFIARERLRFRLRPTPLSITFDRTVLDTLSARDRRTVEFVNHQSPYIRWITRHYMDHGHNFCRTASLRLCTPDIPEGIYLFRVDLLEMTGLGSSNRLCYGIRNLNTGENLDLQTSRSVFSHLLDAAQEWLDYDAVPADLILENKALIQDHMNNVMASEFEYFQSEHESNCMIREKRLIDFYDNKIQRIDETLQKLKDKDKKILRMHEGRKRKLLSERETALARIHSSVPDITISHIAVGLFANAREFAD